MKKLVNLSAKGMENQDLIHENATCVIMRGQRLMTTLNSEKFSSAFPLLPLAVLVCLRLAARLRKRVSIAVALTWRSSQATQVTARHSSARASSS